MAADDLDGLAALAGGGDDARSASTSRPRRSSGPPRRSAAGPAGSSTSRSSASAASAPRWRCTTSATSTASPAGSARCPSSASARRRASTSPPWPTASIRPTSSPSARWFVDDYVVPLIELSAPGILSVPTRPGLGYQVDHAKVRRYQVRQHEFTDQNVGLRVPGRRSETDVRLMTPTDRRQFLTQSARCWPSRPRPRPAQPRSKRNRAMIPIIDTHQHLWDLTIFQLPWQKDNPKLARSFVTRDYLEATAGLNVVKSIYMEVDVEPSQQPAEADHVIAICPARQDPDGGRGDLGPARLGRVQGLHHPVQGQALRSRASARCCTAPRHPPATALHERSSGAFACWATLGLSFDICMRRTELRDAAKLIDACPDTRFILDHCGNASVRAKDRSALEGRHRRGGEARTVVCKVSGIVASAAGQAVDRRRPRPDRQPRPRHLRSRPRHVRRRLARLHPGRDLPPVGRGPQGDRRATGPRPTSASSSTTTPRESTGSTAPDPFGENPRGCVTTISELNTS